MAQEDKKNNKKDEKEEKKEAEKKEQAKPEPKKEEKKAKPTEQETPKTEPSESDEEEVKVPEKFQDIVQKIEQMSVLDLSELVKVLEKKFGVTAQAQVVTGAPGAAQAAPEVGGGQEAEKSSYDVLLKEVGDKKIEVIKAVRDITNKGLKDAKDLVDAVKDGAQEIKKEVAKDEAEEMKKKLEAAGAVVELK